MESWNVQAWEHSIFEVMGVSCLVMTGKKEDFISCTSNKVYAELLYNAAKELNDFVENNDGNKTGLHLKHISGTEYVYAVHSEVCTGDKAEDGTDIVDVEYEEFSSPEEAESYSNQLKDDGRNYFMEPFVSKVCKNDLWVVCNESGENATGMLYPTKIRAIAFAYHSVLPDAFVLLEKYKKYLKSSERKLMLALFGAESEFKTVDEFKNFLDKKSKKAAV